MDAHQKARFRANRIRVIADPCLVGRADFDQSRTRAEHNIGDAEAVSDLDQFASRDDDLACGGELVQGQENRSGAVVNENRRGLQQALQISPGVNVALAPLAETQIVFNVGINAGLRRCGQRRTSEVGVQNYARRIDDALQRRLLKRLESGQDARG